MNMKVIRLPNYAGCFVCGHGNPSGLNVRFDTDGRSVCGRFVATETHMGYHGVLHGGVHSALLDECMGWAACLHRGVLFYAVELNVRFVRPGPLHAPLIVRGRLLDDRGRLCVGEGEIVDEAGTVYSRGKGRYFPLSKAQTAAMIKQIGHDAETPWPNDLDELLRELAKPVA